MRNKRTTEPTYHCTLAQPHTRKSRDILCILFFLGWIAFIIAIFATQTNISSDISRTTIIISPSDGNRRICGQATQIDPFASDFSTFLTNFAQITAFCPVFVAVAQSSFDCATLQSGGIFNSTASKILFRSAQTWNSDQSATKAFQTLSGFVCVPKNQDCSASGKQMLCSAEFLALYNKIATATETDVFQTSAALDSMLQAAVKVDVSNTYLGNMCHKLSSDSAPVTIFSAIGIDYCGIDYIKTIQQLQVIGGISTYLEGFFSGIAGSFVTEIEAHWSYVLASIGLSVALMVVYLILLRFLVGFTLGFTMVCGLGALGFGMYILFSNYLFIEAQFRFQQEAFGIFNQSLKNQYTWFLSGGILMSIVAGVLVIMILIFSKAILIASGTIKAALTSLTRTWFVFFLPIIFVVFSLIHVAWTVPLTYFYYISGNYDALTNSFSFIKMVDTDGLIIPETQYLQVFYFVSMIFTIIWGFFIIYCSFEYIVSACVVQWYFTEDKSARIPKLFSNALKCYFKSFGTVLVTSFITAFVVLLRWCFEYIVKRMEASNKLAQSKIIQAAVWFTRCCLRCLQKITEWINRNIQVCAAITGDGYFIATGKTLRLILGSLFTSVGVKGISKFFLFVGKILISVSSGVICYFLVKSTSQPEMVVAPIIVSTIGSYILSYYIMNIISIVIDTVFFCYLYESTFLKSDVEKGIIFSPKELQAFL
ncbi:Plasma-membrane choline transporter [Spironucleus salmonicida]|uniref:Choline transporter-like protein n=1 Tax=Spironucleus salmonicida TaxID=348837 RepID=V6LW91_9EUKA|nr:Plasma-membrane choline transporter [Spironucleus salmonicida]|eukprot:EST48835.1 Plasma-membrane choline transporter [Spironucleus salmonicida]